MYKQSQSAARKERARFAQHAYELECKAYAQFNPSVTVEWRLAGGQRQAYVAGVALPIYYQTPGDTVMPTSVLIALQELRTQR